MRIEEPSDRVMVAPDLYRGEIVGWDVRIWYPYEGWGIVRSTHATLADAEASARSLRASLRGETLDGEPL